MREGAQHPICAAGAHCMTGVQQCLDERVLYLVWLRYIRFYETSDEREYTQLAIWQPRDDEECYER